LYFYNELTIITVFALWTGVPQHGGPTGRTDRNTRSWLLIGITRKS